MNKSIYTGQSLNKIPQDFTVFLAGPSPRKKSVKSWRPDMIKKLRASGFLGDIIIPEYKSSKSKRLKYNKQVEWEVSWLNKASYILFWVPRDMDTMPALTTNIEFGEFMKSEKVILGYPSNAEHMEYFNVRATNLGIPIARTMDEAVAFIVNAEKIRLYACPNCYGCGSKDSNGRNYRCSTCDGAGYLNPKKNYNGKQNKKTK